MAGNIHAVILLCCPIATILILWRVARRRPSRQTVLLAAFASVVLMCIGEATSYHLCNVGRATTQWFLPAACLFFVLAYAASTKVRWWMAAALVVALIGLKCQYEELVHQTAWTGNPNDRTTELLYARQAETMLRKLSEKSSSQGAAYPAGWLRDMPIWPALYAIAGEEWSWQDELEHPQKSVPIPLWHSVFTRLYRCEWPQADYWYTGGPISTAKVELRTVEAGERRSTSHPVETQGD